MKMKKIQSWSGQQRIRRRSPSRVLVIFRVSLCHCLLFLNRHFRRLHPTLLPPPLVPLVPHHNHNHNHHNVPPDPPNAHLTSRVRVRRLAIRTNDTSLSEGGISGRGGIRRGVMFSWFHLPKAHTHTRQMTQRMQIRRNSPRHRLRCPRLLRYRRLRVVRVLLGLHHHQLLLLLDRNQNILFRYRLRNRNAGLYIP